MPSEVRNLRLSGHGGIAVEDAVKVLSAFNAAYLAVCTFERVADSAQDVYVSERALQSLGLYRRTYRMVWDRDWLELMAVGTDGLPLELAKVELSSPGFWEFVGALTPLETIRNFLNDRHERKKDDRWRDNSEQRKAELDNLILENEAMRGRIDLLKDLGYSDHEIRSLVGRTIVPALRELGNLQDRGIIDDARPALEANNETDEPPSLEN